VEGAEEWDLKKERTTGRILDWFDHVHGKNYYD